METSTALGSECDAVSALAPDEHGKGSGVSHNTASTGKDVVFAVHAIVFFHLLPDGLDRGSLRKVEGDPVSRDDSDDDREFFELLNGAILEEERGSFEDVLVDDRSVRSEHVASEEEVEGLDGGRLGGIASGHKLGVAQDVEVGAGDAKRRNANGEGRLAVWKLNPNKFSASHRIRNGFDFNARPSTFYGIKRFQLRIIDSDNNGVIGNLEFLGSYLKKAAPMVAMPDKSAPNDIAPIPNDGETGISKGGGVGGGR